MLFHVAQYGLEVSGENWNGLVCPPINISIHVQATPTSGFQQAFPVMKWSKRGQTSLFVPGPDPPLDITLCMDISANPGPTHHNQTFLAQPSLKSSRDLNTNERLKYSRRQLMSLRSSSRASCHVLEVLKRNNLLRYRGKRAGRHAVTNVKRGGINFQNLVSIKTVSAYRDTRNISIGLWNARSLVNKIPALCACIRNLVEF